MFKLKKEFHENNNALKLDSVTFSFFTTYVNKYACDDIEKYSEYRNTLKYVERFKEFELVLENPSKEDVEKLLNNWENELLKHFYDDFKKAKDVYSSPECSWYFFDTNLMEETYAHDDDIFNKDVGFDITIDAPYNMRLGNGMKTLNNTNLEEDYGQFDFDRLKSILKVF
jgi:hypothetical protein